MKIIVSVGESDLNFNVEMADFNAYIDKQMPNEKVKSGWNFLIRTVDDADKDELKKIAMRDGKPNGLILMQIVGVITEQIGGDIEVTLKKPKDSPGGSKPTVTKY